MLRIASPSTKLGDMQFRGTFRISLTLKDGTAVTPHMVPSMRDLSPRTRRRVACLVMVLQLGTALKHQGLTLQRPPPSERRFRSAAVDNYIDGLLPRFKNHDLGVLFANCLPNTLDTTIGAYNSSDTFVITGDIPAQWLRDSCNQVLPYMRFAREDPALSQLLCGVVQRQAYSVILNPYANAFNYNNSGNGHQDDVTRPNMTAGVFEAKYELDSLAAFLKVSYQYWNASHNASCFVDDGGRWERAVRTVLQVVRTQQAGTMEEVESEGGPSYTFQRTTTVATDTLMQAGVGAMARRCGLSKSYFRPSDDAVTLPFHVPSNAMLVVELRHLADMLPVVLSSSPSPGRAAAASELSREAWLLAKEIDEALRHHAIITPPHAEPFFAYEVDGFGSTFAMDDANIPSLLALPYLGYLEETDPLYRATRSFVLSDANPYFFKGSAGEGVGGPHVGPSYIWPMSLVMRALTSTDDDEILDMLQLLVQSSAGTGFLHESYHKNDPSNFTRSWFAWVNGLFGELIIKLAAERPHLIFKEAGLRRAA